MWFHISNNTVFQQNNLKIDMEILLSYIFLGKFPIFRYVVNESEGIRPWWNFILQYDTRKVSPYIFLYCFKNYDARYAEVVPNLFYITVVNYVTNIVVFSSIWNIQLYFVNQYNYWYLLMRYWILSLWGILFWQHQVAHKTNYVLNIVN